MNLLRLLVILPTSMGFTHTMTGTRNWEVSQNGIDERTQFASQKACANQCKVPFPVVICLAIFAIQIPELWSNHFNGYTISSSESSGDMGIPCRVEVFFDHCCSTSLHLSRFWQIFIDSCEGEMSNWTIGTLHADKTFSGQREGTR